MVAVPETPFRSTWPFKMEAGLGKDEAPVAEEALPLGAAGHRKRVRTSTLLSRPSLSKLSASHRSAASRP